MTVAERIYKSNNRFNAFRERLYGKIIGFHELIICRFIFIDGSILIWRSYTENLTGYWSIEK